MFLFFFNDPATTEIYTLSLHDALPICLGFAFSEEWISFDLDAKSLGSELVGEQRDRKSTRLNSSHRTISYAVFCLKKKIKNSTFIISIKKIYHTTNTITTSLHPPISIY